VLGGWLVGVLGNEWVTYTGFHAKTAKAQSDFLFGVLASWRIGVVGTLVCWVNEWVDLSWVSREHRNGAK